MHLGSRPLAPHPPAAQKEHPRHDGVGVGLSHAGPHPGKHPPPGASQKREQTEQALACVGCLSPAGRLRWGRGPWAQSTKASSAPGGAQTLPHSPSPV